MLVRAARLELSTVRLSHAASILAWQQHMHSPALLAMAAAQLASAWNSPTPRHLGLALHARYCGHVRRPCGALHGSLSSAGLGFLERFTVAPHAHLRPCGAQTAFDMWKWVASLREVAAEYVRDPARR